MNSDIFIVPPGKATGCLPRRSKPGDASFPLFGERFDVIPEEEWQGLIDQGLGTRRHVHDILDQDGRGSCATEAAHQVLMIGRSYSGQKPITFNPWPAYHDITGGHDNGSNIDDNMRYLRDVGAVPAEIWPRYGPNAHSWSEPLTQQIKEEVLPKYRVDEVLDIQTEEELGTAVLREFAVEGGYSGHAICFVGLSNRKTFLAWLASCSDEIITQAPYYQRVRKFLRTGGDERALARWYLPFANSWDESWGDNGFGMLPMSSIYWGYGLWAGRSVVDAGEPL